VADVVVMDGFVGNIALKLIEGVSGSTLRAVRQAALSSWRSRIGGLLMAPAVRRLRAEIDPEDQGGAYMLGLRQLGVVAHGRFASRGFARAIEVAAKGVQEDVISRTRAALEQAGALRPPRSPSEPAATVSSG
jgi:glycerol-3-phosphate acyltransferase PlsX